MTEIFEQVIRIMLVTFPFWLPVLLGILFWELWITYVRSRFIKNTKSVLLEIKVPRDIEKSPLAMEIALSALYQPSGENTWFDRIWLGKVRSWFSLEMVSLGGDVKFFIWTSEKWKNIIESQIYAQYPTVEIYEVPDYTHHIDYVPGETDMWGCEHKLARPDHFPIKTYIDFGMDKESQLETEQKIDPLAARLELLGALGPSEQMWFQIIVRVHKKERHKPGTFFEKTDWKEQGQKEVEKIMKKVQAVPDSDGKMNPGMMLSPGERETVEAIERATGKYGFDCGMRAIYLAKKEAFRGDNIPGLIGAYKEFSGLNVFKLRHVTSFDYPWSDISGKKAERLKRRLIDAYRRRSYFHSPYKKVPFVLNTEELASLYHFPGGVVQTPTFGRIAAKKVEPPPDLPF